MLYDITSADLLLTASLWGEKKKTHLLYVTVKGTSVFGLCHTRLSSWGQRLSVSPNISSTTREVNTMNFIWRSNGLSLKWSTKWFSSHSVCVHIDKKWNFWTFNIIYAWYYLYTLFFVHMYYPVPIYNYWCREFKINLVTCLTLSVPLCVLLPVLLF